MIKYWNEFSYDLILAEIEKGGSCRQKITRAVYLQLQDQNTIVLKDNYEDNLKTYDKYCVNKHTGKHVIYS
jgi:hypothetical protein